ncbi:cation:proton antiporter [Thermodesulfobacteriota bacterium]
MDPVWIGVAFALGLAARQVSLPPLVGFLAAGFVLHAFGVEPGMTLEVVSDLGITLLLFTIGLKLKLRGLLKPQIWAVGSIHMILTVALFGYGIHLLGLSLFPGADLRISLLMAFALSFSSTVFAVKVLEEKGEMSSLHGRLAIGILVLQDVIAVVFLAVSQGKVPSPWVLSLLLLIPLRPVLTRLMERSGHGELLILFGFLMAVAGDAVFELVRLKGDLGALILGVLLAGHPKASELSKSLLGFKDLFLVGFFLTIGLSGTPTLNAVTSGTILAVAATFKVVLFFLLFTRFKLRARTSMVASFSLATYSEFGLIVGSIAVKDGWITGESLVVIAIAMAITLLFASPLNTSVHSIYARYCRRLRYFETKGRLPHDRPIDPGDAEIVVIGMGRVGTGAYDALRERYGEIVLGMDYDSDTVKEHEQTGRNVILGDATDSDFWEKAQRGRLRLAMLAMPDLSSNIYAAERLAARDSNCIITATAKFDDEMPQLRAAGVREVFNFYSEAGLGFADHLSGYIGTFAARSKESEKA